MVWILITIGGHFKRYDRYMPFNQDGVWEIACPSERENEAMRLQANP